MDIYNGLIERACLLRAWLGRDAGQGMVEYSLIVGLISLAVVGAFNATDMATAISGLATEITNAVNGASL